jgi:hypothetical protein
MFAPSLNLDIARLSRTERDHAKDPRDKLDELPHTTDGTSQPTAENPVDTPVPSES